VFGSKAVGEPPLMLAISVREAIRDADLRDAIASIRAPVQVIMGARDPATPAADGRAMAQRIPGARYAELDASHLCNVESPERFNAELLGFLTT
jgi:3-oxoadipate enol-lactonase/4-carboxymuconolactone decarboxylase